LTASIDADAYNSVLCHSIWQFSLSTVFMTNVDLHCHSNVSDGVLSPAGLAARAKVNGVDVWALTDHDELGGLSQARQAAAELDLHFVAGVEISITWANKTIHIVGLGIDENNPDLRDGLMSVRGGRESRGRDIAAQLEAVGVPGAFEGALKLADNPELLGRTHFARFLVEAGVRPTVTEVFKSFLVEGNLGCRRFHGLLLKLDSIGRVLEWSRAVVDADPP
jgi:predicted metal-dependent phosphoesterase TrpH